MYRYNKEHMPQTSLQFVGAFCLLRFQPLSLWVLPFTKLILTNSVHYYYYYYYGSTALCWALAAFSVS
jgi:hypothetical protein